MDTITVTSRGRIVIPVHMRKRWKISAGARIRIIEKDGAIFLQPQPAYHQTKPVDKGQTIGYI